MMRFSPRSSGGGFPRRGGDPLPPRGDITRRAAAAGVILLVLAALGLRLWSLRVGLPHVFHSDWDQVNEATSMLRDGAVVRDAPYPLTNAYGYVLADLATYAWGRLCGKWSSWESFLGEHFDTSREHTAARAYTAILGALLAAAAYRLARIRLSRRASLLAAALVALSPAHVIYAHQARIHVPGITALILAAAPVARLAAPSQPSGPAGPPGVRETWWAGAAAGLAASVIQYGYLLGACAGILILVRARPWRTALARALVLILGFTLALGLVLAAANHAVEVEASPWFSSVSRLLHGGIPGLGFDVLRRPPLFVLRWIAAEPLVAVGAVLFAAGLSRVPAARREAASFAIYPLLAIPAIGTSLVPVRYSLSLTPFLAILAAAAMLRLRKAWMRRGLIVLALAVPAASSVRYDVLLDRPDTRIELREALAAAGRGRGSVLVDAPLLPSRPPPQGVRLFPPRRDYRATRHLTPGALLERLDMDLVIRPWKGVGSSLLCRIDPADKRYGLAASVRASPGTGRSLASPSDPFGVGILPDAPEYVVPGLWMATLQGPSFEVWARRPGPARALLVALRGRHLPVHAGG